MEPEEKEFQVKMGQLQADIQIWSALCFGFFAAFVAVAIASWQEFFSVYESNGTLATTFLLSIVICFIGMSIVAAVCLWMIKGIRNKMGKL